MNATSKLCVFPAVILAIYGLASPSWAQSLDGTWRGTSTGTPSGGNCRPFTFDIRIRNDSATGTVSTPHTGSPVQWAVTGIATGARIVLIVESADRRLRNPSTRWRGELRSGGLHLEQIGSNACNPTRSGTLRKS